MPLPAWESLDGTERAADMFRYGGIALTFLASIAGAFWAVYNLRHKELQQATQGDRRLSNRQIASIASRLIAEPACKVNIESMQGDPESRQYARDIKEALEKGGWTVTESRTAHTPRRYGVSFHTKSWASLTADAALLKASLEKVGVLVDPFEDPNITGENWEIVVGYRPKLLTIFKEQRQEAADRPDLTAEDE